jgi:predicted permease
VSGLAADIATRVALEELDEEDLLARELKTLRQASAPPPIPAGGPRSRFLGDGWKDLVYAARMLRKSPGFTVAAVLTLALGIGANTAIFSLINATLLQRLPVGNRDRLVYAFRGTNGVFSYPNYAALRDGTRQIDALIAWGGIAASLNADGETDLVLGSIVTGNFFDVLGVTAAHGRLLTTSDDVTPGAHPVAVISHRLWQTRFAGRPDIVGQQIRLNGQLFTIVGVTKPEFGGAQVGVTRDLYVPMMMQALMRPPRAGFAGEMNPDLLKNPNNGWLFALGRLRPGVTQQQAEAELSAISTTFAKSLVRDGRDARPQRVTLVPVDIGDPNQRQQMRSIALLLGGVVTAVLLIACANVANLLLSKAAARRREVAIRLALGASRWRIVRQLLTESVMLGVIGGAGGLFLAWIVMQAFQAAPPPAGALPIALDFAIDRRVLAFSAVLSIMTGLVFGLAPALQASRPGLVPALKDESFVPDGRGRRLNLKNAIVVVEVALSVVLLVAAGLFVRSLRAVQTVDPGIAASELVTAPLNINLLRYTTAQGRAFYERIVERMEQIPGVQAASVARIAVLTGGGRVTSIAVEGRPDSGNRSTSEGGGVTATAGETAFANVIGPDFFRTLGIPLVRGRDFTFHDQADRPLVAVVSETFARHFFPGEDPLGKRFSTGFAGPTGPWTEIIGIVRDSKYATLGEVPAPIVYMPIAQRHETGVTLYVRAAGSPGMLVSQIRREIQTLEPNLPVPDIRTMTDTIGTSLYVPRMGAMLLSLFGGLAVLLASLGVYGVLAFSIARRTREIGIRMALGADRGRVFSLIVREGMTLVAIGLTAGLAAGFYASSSIEACLFNVSTHDAAAFAAAPCALAAVALLACYLPARRAMSVEPVEALRNP